LGTNLVAVIIYPAINTTVFPYLVTANALSCCFVGQIALAVCAIHIYLLSKKKKQLLLTLISKLVDQSRIIIDANNYYSEIESQAKMILE
jgi:hypothetical protein